MKRKFNKIPKLKIRKGDMVMVIAGDSRGAKGRVLQVLVKENKAIVEHVNIVSKHTRPTARNTQGGIVKKEAPIHISNLMILDPKDGRPTRVGRRHDENGKLIRYAKRSGEVIKNG
jgi:large subunit ribosomal protein L24